MHSSVFDSGELEGGIPAEPDSHLKTMHRLLEKTIRHLIHPRTASSRMRRLLQKIRRRSESSLLHLEELMEENGIAAIDYLSIDTEGGELDSLKTIDFERFPIEVVSVENNFADGGFEATMTRNGYNLIAVIGDDDIYLRKNTKQSAVTATP